MVHTQIHRNTYAQRTHVFLCICVYLCVSLCICVYLCVSVCSVYLCTTNTHSFMPAMEGRGKTQGHIRMIHTQIYTHTHIRTYTHTYAHMHTGICQQWKDEAKSKSSSSAQNGGSSRPNGGKTAAARTTAVAKRTMNNVFFEMRKASNHPLLVRSRVSDSDLEILAAELHKLGHFGTQCSQQQVYREISKFSDWDIHNVCLDHRKRLGR
jgi:hypothetical protein